MENSHDFFLAKGRLGNHIFQLGFLKKYNKNSAFMVLPEIGGLFDLFDMPRTGIWFLVTGCCGQFSIAILTR